ncbi:NYN domain-containing protein [Patescibacteria group bacterium]|nr:NYN domain-containing protein [Patescibacteria group bacterium]
MKSPAPAERECAGFYLYCYDILMGIERVNIFIDGGNFYHLALRKLGSSESNFDFEKFAAFLANGRKIVEMGKRFYIGTVMEKLGDKRSIEAMSRQTALFTKLKDNHWETRTSKLRKRLEEVKIDERVVDYKKLLQKGVEKIQYERLREKGIDVKLATDLIVGAVDDKYDVAIVVSSDADIVPAIDWVRNRKHKKIEYIGFSIKDDKDDKKSTTPSLTLMARTDIQRILVASDLKPFIIEGLL